MSGVSHTSSIINVGWISQRRHPTVLDINQCRCRFCFMLGDVWCWGVSPMSGGVASPLNRPTFFFYCVDMKIGTTEWIRTTDLWSG